jgi:catechol 2,3-dioxygenase-like lactoylglutathione lyase family enzyme
MFSHVTIGSNDIARARGFYDRVTSPLGLVRHADIPTAWAGCDGGRRTVDRPPSTRRRPPSANGLHRAGGGQSSAVDAATPRRLPAAGRRRAGIRKHYHPNYYGAMCATPTATRSGIGKPQAGDPRAAVGWVSPRRIGCRTVQVFWQPG